MKTHEKPLGCMNVSLNQKSVRVKVDEIELFQTPRGCGLDDDDPVASLTVYFSDFLHGDDTLLEEICKGLDREPTILELPDVNVEITFWDGETQIDVGCRRKSISYHAGLRLLHIDGPYWKRTTWE